MMTIYDLTEKSVKSVIWTVCKGFNVKRLELSTDLGEAAIFKNPDGTVGLTLEDENKIYSVTISDNEMLHPYKTSVFHKTGERAGEIDDFYDPLYQFTYFIYVFPQLLEATKPTLGTDDLLYLCNGYVRFKKPDIRFAFDKRTICFDPNVLAKIESYSDLHAVLQRHGIPYTPNPDMPLIGLEKIIKSELSTNTTPHIITWVDLNTKHVSSMYYMGMTHRLFITFNKKYVSIRSDCDLDKMGYKLQVSEFFEHLCGFDTTNHQGYGFIDAEDSVILRTIKKDLIQMLS